MGYLNDPYSSLFWWWLLDRSIDEQAYWAYHHRYDMDSGRYDALMASNQQLQNRVTQLEAQQIYELYRDVEIPLVGVLADLEWVGVEIDRTWFASLKERFARGYP